MKNLMFLNNLDSFDLKINKYHKLSQLKHFSIFEFDCFLLNVPEKTFCTDLSYLRIYLTQGSRKKH